MLLSKLKWVSAVVLAFAVSAGAVGLTYRLTAAEPKPARSGAAVASRAGQDELEELRLEIAALRKGLQATRERVTDLEEEVRTQKAQGRPRAGGAPPGMMMGMMGGSGGGGFSGGAGFGGGRGGYGALGGGMGALGGFPGGAPGSPAGPRGAKASKQPKAAGDPLTEAEAALRRLRQHPDDKQAADALERALKQLKERAKPQGAEDGRGKE